jgi:hypothetical protein
MTSGLYRRLLSTFARNVAFTRRAVVALLMIGSLFLAQFGYPVWEVAEGKGDEPFPCQFSRCGCRTREQCRQSCCCHTKEQKIAWALARGIDPDRVAILTPAEKTRYATSPPKSAAKSFTCCQTSSTSCCKPAKKPCCGGATVAKTDAKPQLRWVLAIEAQKCHGTGVEWIQAGFVAPPPLPVTLTIIPRETPAVSDPLPLYFPPVAEPLLRPV